MRKEIKEQANVLAEYLESIRRKITHGQAIEAISRLKGAKSWNVLSADAPRAPAASSTTPLKTTLHAALQVSDEVTLIFRGSLSEEEHRIVHRFFGPNDEPVILENGAEDQWTFPPQEIEIDSDGEATIRSLDEEYDPATGSTEYIPGDEFKIRFEVTRPLSAGELPDTRPVKAPAARSTELPFKLPVRLEDAGATQGPFLVAADCELITPLPDATPEEAAAIVSCINAAGGSAASTASAQLPATRATRVLEANMLDLVGDYDVPESVPEWAWIKTNSSFRHVENGNEGGVWEMMVYCGHMNMPQDTPPKLQPVFAQAKATGAVWVMFHQG